MVYTRYMNEDVPTTVNPAIDTTTVFQQPTAGFATPNQVATPQAVPQPAVTTPKPEPVPQTTQPQPIEQPQDSTEEELIAAYAQQQAGGYFPEIMRPTPEELIYAWQAPSRPFKKHNRNYYSTVGVIVILVSLILIFAGQVLPIAVVLAVTFLAYVLTSIPPQTVTYTLTTYGIRIEDKLYYWQIMSRFWYTEKYGDRLLNIEISEFPERITLVIRDANENLLTEILSEILLQQQPAYTLYERVAKWLQDKFPLDLDS